MEIFIAVLIFVIGIVIGSFLNVVIYRVPKEESIASSPSACQSCGHRLTAIDMIPIFSFVFLGGKCRHCKAKISPQYPIVEALTGALFLLLYLKFGLSYWLLVYAALAALLVAISFIDFKHMIIPNGLVIAMLVVGAAVLAATIFTGYFGWWLDYVIGFFAGGLPLLLIGMFTMYVLKKEAIGGGDIKLMAAAGLVIGWKLVIPAYLIGIVLGAIVSVILLATKIKKRGDEIPFGPYLCVGIMASVFFGNELIDWYLGLM